MKRVVIPFFTDDNVPDSVGNVLAAAGHQLTRLRDVMEKDTPDPVIAIACSKFSQVLVTHDRDFRDLSKWLKITQRQYQNTLHRVKLSCPEPRDASRIAEALSLIEAEWQLIREGRPMRIEIRDKTIITWR